ncbi:MAG: AI-2E family transporter [Candidatus Moraniibacteriota bacterium]
MQTKEAVQIGTTLILRIAFVLVAAWLVYLLRDIVFLVLAAMLTSMALRPAIIKLSRYGLSRSAAVIIVYAVIFLGGVGLLALFIPLLFSEVKDFLAAWPAYLNQLDTTLAAFQVYLEEFGIPFSREQFLVGADGTFGHWFGSLFSTTVDIARGLIHFIGYFFLSLYLSLEEKGLEKLSSS